MRISITILLLVTEYIFKPIEMAIICPYSVVAVLFWLDFQLFLPRLLVIWAIDFSGSKNLNLLQLFRNNNKFKFTVSSEGNDNSLVNEPVKSATVSLNFDLMHGFTISVPVLILPVFWQLLLWNGKISKCESLF